MAVIDVQVHAYERNYPGRPWVGHLHGSQSANGEEMVTAIDAVGALTGRWPRSTPRFANLAL
jgi:L-fuconolactonase